MPKKKEFPTIEEVTRLIEADTNTKIALLDLNFGREDMNQLVDKVNEIIKKVNL